MNIDPNSTAYKTVTAAILSKLTYNELALDAIHLTAIATTELNDRRWTNQHPIRLLHNARAIGTRYNRCIAPVWFDDYLELVRRVFKKSLLALPEVTKVRFSHAKGKYFDISLDTNFMEPYRQGMLEGIYPDNARTVLAAVIRNTPRNRPCLGVLFKGVNCSYTFRISYGHYVGALSSRYACSIGGYLDIILAAIAEHLSLVSKPEFSYLDIFNNYNRMEES